MVRVEIERAADGAVVAFSASGHAGFSYRGTDIVCAAVSVLTQTAVNALPEHAGVTPAVEIDEESGYLRCVLPAAMGARERERAQLILETMVTGLRGIAREYSDYIQLKEVGRR